jgi:hypothetical protein
MPVATSTWVRSQVCIPWALDGRSEAAAKPVNLFETIDVPRKRVDRPNREFLEWHLDTVFKAA